MRKPFLIVCGIWSCIDGERKLSSIRQGLCPSASWPWMQTVPLLQAPVPESLHHGGLKPELRCRGRLFSLVLPLPYCVLLQHQKEKLRWTPSVSGGQLDPEYTGRQAHSYLRNWCREWATMKPGSEVSSSSSWTKTILEKEEASSYHGLGLILFWWLLLLRKYGSLGLGCEGKEK